LPREVVNVVAKMMALDPDERFQSAGDVRRAVEALLSQAVADPAASEPRAKPASAPQQTALPQAKAVVAPAATSAAAQANRQPTVMLVEKSRKSQETLRRFLQNLGYRVLLTESPRRALSRFATRPLPADCLVISAQELGDEAVEAFNELSTDSFFAEVPAILIASGRQEGVLEAAQFDHRRRLLQIPINSEKMISLLTDLIPSSASGSAVAG
jgi:CheY-like chemotaxis protein